MRKWYIPDCYWHSISNGEFVSHEAVCVLNTTTCDATVNLTMYFEDRDPVGGYSVVIPAQRTIHIRIDKIKNNECVAVPQDTPYAIVVESEVENLTVQYTRVDSSQNPLALCTTIVQQRENP